MKKVLVVDDGDRSIDHALAVELAELGYASVTTSFEAVEDVLRDLPLPSAVVLQMPDPSQRLSYGSFQALARRLEERLLPVGVPVIRFDRASAFRSGGCSAVLQSEFASYAVAKPDL